MEIPQNIQEKFDQLNNEVTTIIETAQACVKIDVRGSISFTYSISAPRDVLTDFERAQSVCFVAKYDSLPVFKKVSIQEREGNYYFGNIHEARHVLNEYRSIIQNQNDSINYRKLHKFCRDKLLNDDPAKDLCIEVNHEELGDITHEFIKSLDEYSKAISKIIEMCEFDYIYNGILQHSDHRHTERFWAEYSSGKINYIFAKHALILVNIKGLLEWHYRLFSVMTFPKLGPL